MPDAPRAGRRPRRAGRPVARGVSLVIAMVMLAVIGLVSAAMMRGATVSSQVANNGRLLTQAAQYAQVALRFCELQLTLPASTRALAPWPAAADPAWAQRADWTGGGATPAHTLAAPEINAAAAPRVPPQCLVEATAAPQVYTVTARGFSADFAADPSTGAPRNGAVVWLQSTVLLDRPAEGPHGAGPRAAAVDMPDATARAAATALAAEATATDPAAEASATDPAAHAAAAHAAHAAFTKAAQGPKTSGAAAAPSLSSTAPSTDPCAGDCAPTIVQRVWQQLLTPPF